MVGSLCPSHQGIEGNEVADESANLAADEPDAHGVNGSRPRTRTARSPRESSLCRGPSPTSSEGSLRRMAGRQGLRKGKAGPHQQLQVPPQRQAETGRHGRQGQ